MADHRQLRVVLFSDVVDSTRTMFKAEDQAVSMLTHDLALLRALLPGHGGEWIKGTGDGILATFATTGHALAYVRHVLNSLPGGAELKLQHRFALHAGEVYVHGDDRFGESVHLAARLLSVSPAGGVAFTETTFAMLEPRYRRQAVALGLVKFKGVPESIPCHALTPAGLQQSWMQSSSGARLAEHLLPRLPWLRASSFAPRQIVAAFALLGLALFCDLDPSNPLNRYLLDRRLLVQKVWRERTAQPGPLREPLAVVLLQSDAPTLPRQEITRLLRAATPERYPRIALDVVMDRIGASRQATQELVDVLTRQRREAVYIGTFDSRSRARGVGVMSNPLPAVVRAGAQPRNLAIGTAAGPVTVKLVPLQLVRAVGPDSMAAAIAGDARTSMPVDAVLDWSLAWDAMVKVVPIPSQTSSGEPMLIVGRLSDGSGPDPDLFTTPAAFQSERPVWGGAALEMPGAVLLAVVAQSIRLRHWLTPVPQVLMVAAAVGSGLILSSFCQQRGRSLLLLVVVLPLAGLMAVQLAVSATVLVPVVLPALAVSSMLLLRKV